MDDITRPSIQQLYGNMQKEESNSVSFRTLRFVQEHYFSFRIEFPTVTAVQIIQPGPVLIKPLIAFNIGKDNVHEIDAISFKFTIPKIYDLYSDKEKSITQFVRSVSIPSIIGKESPNVVETPFGMVYYPDFGDIKPERQYLTIDLTSVESQVIEFLFLKWLEHTRSSQWLFEEIPFEKGDIIIDFYDQQFEKIIMTYKFHDCFPTFVDTIDPTHDYNFAHARTVQMVFDYMTFDGALPSLVTASGAEGFDAKGDATKPNYKVTSANPFA